MTENKKCTLIPTTFQDFQTFHMFQGIYAKTYCICVGKRKRDISWQSLIKNYDLQIVLITVYENTGIKCNVFFERLKILFHCTATTAFLKYKDTVQ